MRDVPPDSLIARLTELRVCTAADVHRARGLVRRMTRDLPVFDSVWVDALTQQKALTPFQSRWLETFPPETLVAGDFFLIDGLGAGTASHTFLAKGPDRRRVVLKQLTIPEAHADSVELRLQLLLERSRNVASPHLAAPTALVKSEHRLFVAGRHVPGLNLSELLIRRGRFPSDVVASVADQLLAALSAWHATGSAHGDLRLSKLRLTDRGQIVLVDCGLAPAIAPEILVHAVRSTEAADVIAPERIGTNLPATAATDLYAAGCLLWQLLSGRPPHATADPLAKLAAHRTRRIPDVRELAPETPATLAEIIARLTSPDPQERPTSAEAARRQSRTRRGAGTSGLARFRRQFDTAVPHLATRAVARRRTWTWLAAAAILLGLATVIGSDRGLRTELLEVAQRTWKQPLENIDAAKDDDEASAHRTAGRLLQIPRPDADGVIRLTERGPYEIRDLSQVGSLTLLADDDVRPQIVIRDDAWNMTAQQIALHGLDVVWKGSAAPLGPGALVRLKSQRIAIAGCRFVGPMHCSGEDEPEFAAVTWELLDPRDPQAGVIEIERTVLQGAMQGVTCLSPPRHVTWRHVLKTHPGSAVHVEQAPAERGFQLLFDSVTLRDTGPVLSCSGPLSEQASSSLIEIAAQNCVFALAESSPIVALRGPKARDDWAEAIRFTGDGCLVPPGTTLLAAVDPARGLRSVLESEELAFDGLFTDEFEFAGPVSQDPADAQLVKSQAPRRSESLPGIRIELLPR